VVQLVQGEIEGGDVLLEGAVVIALGDPPAQVREEGRTIGLSLLEDGTEAALLGLLNGGGNVRIRQGRDQGGSERFPVRVNMSNIGSQSRRMDPPW